MQDFEKPRYAKALALFEESFWEGFARGEKALAAGLTQKDPTIDSVLHVDIPRDDVLDDLYEGHALKFAEAGFQAARATRRVGRPKLDTALSDPDSREAAKTGKLRWCVLLT